MAADTTTIRVSVRTRDALKVLASRRGATADELVSELVARADEDALLADATDGFNRIAARRATSAAYRGEIAELDSFDSAIPPW